MNMQSQKWGHEQNWVINEIKTSNLGDKRLNKRLGNILELLAKQPEASISVKSNNWHEIKAAYRFFDNDVVDPIKILQPHYQAALKRIGTEKAVLIAQDTTELDYSSKKATVGIGKLHYENHKGAFLHASIAVTPERICLGLVGAKFFTRDTLGKKDQQNIPIEDKESIRWLEGYNIANDIAIACPNTIIVSVADRECDIYEVLAASKANCGGAQWIIRNSKDRCLIDVGATINDTNGIDNNISDTKNTKKDKLWKRLDRSAVIGTVEFDINRTPKRKARHIKQEIKAVSVTLQSPHRKVCKIHDFTHTTEANSVVIINNKVQFFDGINLYDANINKLTKLQKAEFTDLQLATDTIISKKLVAALFKEVDNIKQRLILPPVTINAVMASEIDASEGVKPIEWVLLTSLPIITATECLQVVAWYLCRWQIEIFFKILKDGCKVEELQLQTLDRLTNCIALYMIISWRILFMTMLGRSCPDLPCTVVFSTEEWQTAYMMTYRMQPPTMPPTLNEMIIMVAGFGGFLKRKCDKNPGNQSLWIGIQRVRDFAAGIALSNDINLVK